LVAVQTVKQLFPSLHTLIALNGSLDQVALFKQRSGFNYALRFLGVHHAFTCLVVLFHFFKYCGSLGEVSSSEIARGGMFEEISLFKTVSSLRKVLDHVTPKNFNLPIQLAFFELLVRNKLGSFVFQQISWDRCRKLYSMNHSFYITEAGLTFISYHKSGTSSS
jgi:hypothetical protein